MNFFSLMFLLTFFFFPLIIMIDGTETETKMGDVIM